VIIARFFILLIATVLLAGCGKKEETSGSQKSDKEGFGWTDVVSLDKIPDFPVRGMLNGKEFKVEYINFETWRGSEDNVINFTAKAPRQNCGAFSDDDSGFRIIKKSGEFKAGDYIKDKFSTTIEGIIADYHYNVDKNNTKNVSPDWNYALKITDINSKTVRGKVVICFKDESKSWIAGTFEAVRCNN
jgi:hypothetical protein